jgi:hypothetical protein
LWLDESMLALNILDRSVIELLRPLSFSQAAPPAFLLIEKCFSWIFGSSEYALRLFPLLCGLASLPLFAVLARRTLNRPAAVVATLLFAVATGPVYYASEVKPYGPDVTVALILLLLGGTLARTDLRARSAAAIAVTGAFAILVSFPAVFIAGAVSLVLALGAALQRIRPPLATVAAVASWLAASVVIIVVSRHTAARVEVLFSYDPNAYAAAKPTSFLQWLRELPTHLASDIGLAPWRAPFGRLYWAAVLLSIVGAVSLAMRRRLYAGFFAAAIGLTLVGSAIHRYPLADRTDLFLVPIAIVLLAEGVSVAAAGVRHGGTRRLVLTALGALVLAVPGWRALNRLIDPPGREEMKTALADIRARWQAGDTMYVSDQTQYALRYYLECDCLSAVHGRGRTAWRFRFTPDANTIQANALRSIPPRFIVGKVPTDGRRSYVRDVAALRGRPRVWLLYSHVGDASTLTYIRQGLPRDLERIGRRLETIRAGESTVYLYDLRRRSR